MSTNMNPARILGRITIQGTLQLDAPLLIGEGASGEERSDRDIHVLRDKEGIPFIPGTSLAGALRSFVEEDMPDAAELLFGTLGTSSDRGAGTDGRQSAAMLCDIVLAGAQLGVRDGVSLDGITGTTVPHGKYDYEIVESGARGEFYAEITLRGVHEAEEKRIKNALLRLRDLLISGFCVGALTTKGFGRMHVAGMQVDCYDFSRKEDVAAWLFPKERKAAVCRPHIPAVEELPHPIYTADDFMVEADFALAGSLIIRDYEDANRMTAGGKNGPDARMKKNAAGAYIIPGTSLKGMLRHRAAYILHALGKDEAAAEQLMDELMGPSPEQMKKLAQKDKRRSRFIVEETVVVGEAHKQTRIRANRFTGGTIPSALFSSVPIWQRGEGHAVTLHFGARRAKGWEAGLCILLLKDLWLGRIAIGGEKSIGRGLLTGLRADIHYRGRTWTLTRGEVFDESTARDLQEFVTALDKEAGI